MDTEWLEDVEALDINVELEGIGVKAVELWDPEGFTEDLDTYGDTIEYEAWTAPDRVTPVVVVPVDKSLDRETFHTSMERWITYDPDQHVIENPEESDYEHIQLRYHEGLNAHYTTDWSSHVCSLDADEVNEAIRTPKSRTPLRSRILTTPRK